MARKSRKDKLMERADSVEDSIPQKRPVPRPAAIVAMGVVLLFLGLTVGIVIDVVTKPDPVRPSFSQSNMKPKPAPAPAVVNAPRSTSIFDESARDSASREPLRRFTPMTLNAVPSDAPEDWPVVAIVIDDMGLDRRRGDRITALPGPLTLSFLTYAEGLNAQADAAREAGHEVLAHVPMEPEGNADPGPGALVLGATPTDIRNRLDAYLNDWSGYVGINNHMGSRLTADRASMDVVMAELQTRGLLWLDSRTGTGTVAEEAAAALAVPHIGRDVFLDNEDDRSAIDKQLRKVEDLARSRGYAVAIGHPRDLTIHALAAWLPALEEKGIALVPVTEAVRRALRSSHPEAVRPAYPLPL